jgi:hypothetical protein
MNIKTEIKNIFGKVRVWGELLKFPHKRLGGDKRTNLYNAALKSYLSEDKAVFNAIKALRVFPVTIEEFLTNKEYLGAVMNYWPETIQKLKDTLPDIWNGEIYQDREEVTFTGRRGKTVLLTATFLYIYYIHHCFNNYEDWGYPRRFILASGWGGRDVFSLRNHISTFMSKVPYFYRTVEANSGKTGLANTLIVPNALTEESLIGTRIAACFIDNVNIGKDEDDFIKVVTVRMKIRDLTPPEILFPFTQAIYIATEYQH